MSRAPRTTEKQESVDEYLASWHATMKLLREGRSFSGRERNRAFLNCGNSSFANISSVSGLDFADDGRALASVDWDHDGDLDLWLHNRTGPRLRMMQNQTISGQPDSEKGFLSLDLRGTRSNRDAIGARVEVVLQDSLPLVQTLHAGDGYLSQSSKSLHFGLGANTKIEYVTVRWPHGHVERFSGIAANRRYLLVEGSEQAQPVARPGSPTDDRVLKLAASKQVAPKPTAAARIVLSNRLPMPILQPSDYDGALLPAIETKDRPLLLSFWASWCAPCVKELAAWAEQADSLRDEGADVLVLSVDGMGVNDQQTPADAQAMLNRIAFPFSHAMANPELIDKLAVVQRIVLNQQPPFAVPTSFLLDRDGQLAAIYRGPVSTQVLNDDIRRLNTPVADRRDLAIPFRGSWSSKPRTLLLNSVATVFKERGYLSDYARFVELDLEQRNRQRSIANSDEEKQLIDDEFAATQFNLARTLQSHGQRSEAIEHFRQGLAVKPADGLAHYYLARLFVLEQEIETAIQHFQLALTSDPKMVPAHIALGRTLQSQGQADQAISHFRQALEIAPQSVESHFHLGVSLASQKNSGEAIEHFQQTIDIQPDHVDAHTNLGVLLAASGQLENARLHLAQAVDLNPDHLQARMNYGGALGSSGKMRAAADQFAQTVKIHPELPAAHARLAQSLLSLGDEAGAATHFEKAIALRPSDGASMLRLAWIWATSSDESLRNGGRALAMAKEVNTATGGTDPRALDVLAAAHAEQGEFESAVRIAERALDQLGKKNASLAAAIRQRLNSYGDARPHREKRDD